jgi:hypothetical protein
MICAPFQEIDFPDTFDFIFCIGVLEYSVHFFDDADPYDSAFRKLGSLLAQNGTVFVAIENKLGLKYFSGAREDHSGIRYDGIEGYSRSEAKARTFGERELGLLGGKYFNACHKYFPFPDYKIPDVVVAEEAFAKTDISELITRNTPEDYPVRGIPKFSHTLVHKQLQLNGLSSALSNSFLFAFSNGKRRYAFPQLAFFATTKRRRDFVTFARVRTEGDGKLTVYKQPAGPTHERDFHVVPTTSQWVAGDSLELSLICRVRSNCSIEGFITTIAPWMEHVTRGRLPGSDVSGDLLTFDDIFSNFICSERGLHRIDEEWRSAAAFTKQVLILRAVNELWNRLAYERGLPRRWLQKTAVGLARDIARAAGLPLHASNLLEFVRFQRTLSLAVRGRSSGAAGYLLMMKMTLPLGISIAAARMDSWRPARILVNRARLLLRSRR